MEPGRCSMSGGTVRTRLAAAHTEHPDEKPSVHRIVTSRPQAGTGASRRELETLRESQTRVETAPTPRERRNAGLVSAPLTYSDPRTRLALKQHAEPQIVYVLPDTYEQRCLDEKAAIRKQQRKAAEEAARLAERQRQEAAAKNKAAEEARIATDAALSDGLIEQMTVGDYAKVMARTGGSTDPERLQCELDTVRFEEHEYQSIKPLWDLTPICELKCLTDAEAATEFKCSLATVERLRKEMDEL
ncbi:MAG: hypothetical protein C5B59_00520 [Bacteroidetes bacterium]|nr:MAG: hypothetical protein C5B59_00520 [Bacteroidota bacterium]